MKLTFYNLNSNKFFSTVTFTTVGYRHDGTRIKQYYLLSLDNIKKAGFDLYINNKTYHI